MELNFDIKTLLYISTLRILTHDDHKIDHEEKEYLNKIAGLLGLATPEKMLLENLSMNKNQSFIQSKFYSFSETEKMSLLKVILECISADNKLENKERIYLEIFLLKTGLQNFKIETLAKQVKELKDSAMAISEFSKSNQITAILCLTELIFTDSNIHDKEVESFEKIFQTIQREDFVKSDFITGLCIYIEMLLTEPNMEKVPKNIRIAIANFLIFKDKSYNILSLISLVLEICVLKKTDTRQIESGIKIISESFQLNKAATNNLMSLSQHFKVLGRDTYQKASLLNSLEIHLELKKTNPVNLHYLKQYMEKFNFSAIDEKQKVGFLILIVEACYLDERIRSSEIEIMNEILEHIGISEDGKKQIQTHLESLKIS